jgi:hypothetical protein
LTVVTGTASSDITAITLTTEFPLSTSLSSSSSGSPGLSLGAKIAIGVAVPIVVIAMLVRVCIKWCRKRYRCSTRQLLTSNPELSIRGYPKESVVAPIVSLLSSQGTRFQGTEAELDYNLMAYIPFRSPSAASPYAEKAQEIGAGKEDDDDLGEMRKELD